MAAGRAAETSGRPSADGALISESSLAAHPKSAPRVHRPVVRESDFRKFGTQVRPPTCWPTKSISFVGPVHIFSCSLQV